MVELQRRIEKLEMRLSRVIEELDRESCICGKVIFHHTSDELQLILAEQCPIHGIVKPKFIMWRPENYPLAPEYRKYCKCPSNPWRDFLEGKRLRPTRDELMEHNNARVIPQSDKEGRLQSEREFQQERARITDIIARHEEALRTSRENQ